MSEEEYVLETKSINGYCQANTTECPRRGIEITLRSQLTACQKELAEAKNRADANDFWKNIVCTDGQLDVEQVKKEMADYYFVLEQVPKVYMHITGEQLSKPNYYASGVIECADSYQQDCINEEVEDATKEIKSQLAEAKAEIERLKYYEEQFYKFKKEVEDRFKD